MASKEIERKRNELLADLTETACRIRRYSLDPRLRMNAAPAPGAKKPFADSDFGEYLRQEAEAAWEDWMRLRDDFTALPDSPTLAELLAIERKWLNLDRKVDLIQRDLIGANSLRAGAFTFMWLA